MKDLSDKQIEKLFSCFEEEKVKRARIMPDEQSAINRMFEAFLRLQELGWKEAMYCPKDGSMFSTIEAGSTGIHKSNYVGEWPTGRYYTYDGDVWPSKPVLWRKRIESDPEIDLGIPGINRKCCAK